MTSTETIIRLIRDDRQGQISLDMHQLIEVFVSLERPKAKIVVMWKNAFVSFANAKGVHFCVPYSHDEQFDFIERKTIIHGTKQEVGIPRFLFNEFFDGKNIFDRVARFLCTLLPIIIINVLIASFASAETVQNLITGLLTAVSVFVAIFTLFTVSNEYWNRRRLSIFESGKLSYYFSIDKNIAKLGIYTILLSLIGIITIQTDKEKWSPSLIAIFDLNRYLKPEWIDALKEVMTLFAVNVGFFFTYILLRSIVEFYIIRPGKFIMGDMKKESLDNITDEKRVIPDEQEDEERS